MPDTRGRAHAVVFVTPSSATPSGIGFKPGRESRLGNPEQTPLSVRSAGAKSNILCRQLSSLPFTPLRAQV